MRGAARAGIVTNPDGTISLPALPSPASLTPEVLEAMADACMSWDRLASLLHPTPPVERVIRCKFCDKAFKPKAHNTEYCSNRCCKKAMRQRTGHGPRVQTERCEVCDEPLDKRALRADATVCSEKCRIEKKNRLRRARKGTGPKPETPKPVTAPKLTEEKHSEAKVSAALVAYEREEVGLRGGAAMLGVTAPTFSEILRRAGKKVRPAPRWKKGTAPKRPGGKPPASRTQGSDTPDGRLTEIREHPSAPAVSPPQRRTEPPARPARQTSGRTLPASPENDMARRAIVNVLMGGVKLPPKPASDMADSEDVDQAEWDRCRSWRRMLIGLQWGKADVPALLRSFLAVVRERAPVEMHGTLARADRAANSRDPATVWEACSLAVSALRDVLPNRSSIDAEIALCDLFRAKHPSAPRDPDEADKGFSSVGH